MNFGAVGRFAGERLLGNIGNAYNAIDNQIGGILPYGTANNIGELATEIGKDAMPGKRPVPGSAGAQKANATASHIARGDLDYAATTANSGALAAKTREHLVEEGVERGAKALGRRMGTFAIPVVGPVIGTLDTVNDAKGAYSSVLEATTGHDLDHHIGLAGKKRGNATTRLNSLFPEATNVSPSDGSIPQIVQGEKTNPIAQEIMARAQEATNSFNPAKGEWGMTEMLYGR
jgi:hypothetical protein